MTQAGLGETAHSAGHPHGTACPPPAPSPIVGGRLTQAAYAHGLALALPEKVEMARPTGVSRADDICVRIPIESAREWLTTSTETA